MNNSKNKKNRILTVFVMSMVIAAGIFLIYQWRQSRNGVYLHKEKGAIIDRSAVGPSSDKTSANPRAPLLTPKERKIRTVSMTKRQKQLVEGAASRIGDKYDSGYYSAGYPPKGRSACVDVLYFSCKNAGIDLQGEVNKDIKNNPRLYPVRRDSAINHRWAPNLIVWFKRHAKSLDKKDPKTYKPGDVVFWSLMDDGTADHCGVIGDKVSPDGIPLVIHQFPPRCKEEDCLAQWRIMGHFRP